MTERILRFREARDWKQFHNPKDLALSLSLEAAEVLELMQWRNGDELRDHLAANRERAGEELSDVLYWTLLLAHDLGVDLAAAFETKMLANDAKYPADRAKGRHTKYTDL
jgi:NTP pyrophosphatase (non-canonical NTP hydrolase)